jgi:hypothetical protein
VSTKTIDQHFVQSPVNVIVVNADTGTQPSRSGLSSTEMAYMWLSKAAQESGNIPVNSKQHGMPTTLEGWLVSNSLIAC